ncbi:hypothetical protein ACX9I7_32505 [Streptomyces sp. L500]|uniref:hypothetical protein n=1 Tax=Streptomyces abikoensis TaxID=97398 RepID=UPI0036886F88
MDGALLTQFVAALETGDTKGLTPLHAKEASAARPLFRLVRVPGTDGVRLDGALWKHTGGEPRPLIVMPSPWTNARLSACTERVFADMLAGENTAAEPQTTPAAPDVRLPHPPISCEPVH